MNKKFLSAILFGALMVTSTGTFVSCKDYDDDIDRIDTELSGIKSQIAALQTAVDNGKWITNVVSTSDGIAITMSDGTTYNVTNGKDGAPGADGAPGEAGAAGDKVEINADGFFVINGEVTEWKALAKDATTGETVKVKIPEMSEDGFWVFYDEKGEAHETTWKVAPVTAVENSDKSWTLTVFDANGGSQTINVPSAASLLTDLVVVDPEVNLTYWRYNFAYKLANGVTEYTLPDRDKWKGPRALPAKDGCIVAGMTTIPVQINPTTVDATGIDFSLVNSNNGYPDYITLSASEDYTLQAAESRAAYGNGRYQMSMEDVYFTNTEINYGYYDYYFGGADANSQHKDDYANYILYAVTAGGDVRSAYTVAVKEAESGLVLNNVLIYSEYNPIYTTGTNKKFGSVDGTQAAPACKGINMGQWYSVVGSEGAALYDMYLSVDNDYTTLYGIELKNEEGNWQFRITRTPDNITRATFPLVVGTVDKEGTYNKTTIWVKQSDILSTGYAYDAISYQLKDVEAGDDKAYNKNRFSIALSEMKEFLGADNLALWNTKADLSKTYVCIVDPVYNSTVAEGYMNSSINGIKPIIVEKNSDGQPNTIDKNKANYVQFQVANTQGAAATYALNYQYVANITFNTVTEQKEVAELTTISVPFTLTIPAITSVFQLDNNFIVNGDDICYMYAEDWKQVDKTNGASTFKLNRVFSKFSTNSYTLKLDDSAKVGETGRTSAHLATVGTTAATSTKTATDTYITLRNADTDGTNLRSSTTGLQAGYGESLKLSISGNFAGVWSYGKETFDFTVKVLSPIYEGGVKPKTGNAVEIPATELDGYKFGNNDIIGNTYNTAVTYNVLPDLVNKDNVATPDWKRVEIAEVLAQSSNTNVFTVDKPRTAEPYKGWADPVAAKDDVDEDDKPIVVDGYFTLNAQNVPTTTSTNAITVQVTDIWGYVKPSTVNVTITVE